MFDVYRNAHDLVGKHLSDVNELTEALACRAGFSLPLAVSMPHLLGPSYFAESER